MLLPAAVDLKVLTGIGALTVPSIGPGHRGGVLWPGQPVLPPPCPANSEVPDHVTEVSTHSVQSTFTPPYKKGKVHSYAELSHKKRIKK